MLIGVDIVFAQYLEINKPAPVVLLEVKGMLTGSPPDLGEVERIEGAQLRR